MRPTQQRVRSQTQSRTTTNAVQRAKMRAKRRAPAGDDGRRARGRHTRLGKA